VVVVRSISDAGSLVSVKDTKGHASRRIALDPTALDVLRDHRSRCDDRTVPAGIELSPNAYVWSEEIDGSGPYRPNRVTATFRALRDKAGRQVTFHALGNFAATALAGKGVGIRTIASRLGHANPSVTVRTYAHFLEAADQEAATAMGAIAAAHFVPGGQQVSQG